MKMENPVRTTAMRRPLNADTLGNHPSSYYAKESELSPLLTEIVEHHNSIELLQSDLQETNNQLQQNASAISASNNAITQNSNDIEESKTLISQNANAIQNNANAISNLANNVVTSVNDMKGDVKLTKTSFMLGLVENTRDVDKVLSNPTKTYVDSQITTLQNLLNNKFTDLIGMSPDDLNTIYELAQRLVTDETALTNIATQITNANNSINTKENAIASGQSTDYFDGTKTWRNFATSVRNSALTGISFLSNSAIIATDTVLSALGKLQKQISDLVANLADNYYSKTQADNNFYSKTQIDNNNYSKTEINNSFYTKTQVDNNTYSKTQADNNFFSKTLSDERYALINHVHSNATSSVAGFLSASDKSKLDALSLSKVYMAKATYVTVGTIIVGGTVSQVINWDIAFVALTGKTPANDISTFFEINSAISISLLGTIAISITNKTLTGCTINIKNNGLATIAIGLNISVTGLFQGIPS